jgi:hypothetical protein
MQIYYLIILIFYLLFKQKYHILFIRGDTNRKSMTFLRQLVEKRNRHEFIESENTN